MLWQSIRFEWRYYLRQPSFYVTSLLFFLMTFLAASSESIQIGGGGEVLGNGPFSVNPDLGNHAHFLDVFGGEFCWQHRNS